jgi:hypothetical protein
MTNETYIYDKHTSNQSNNYYYKGRLYEIVDKKNKHLWYSIEFWLYLNNILISSGGVSDFQNGNYYGIPQNDLNRAVKKVVKGVRI